MQEDDRLRSGNDEFDKLVKDLCGDVQKADGDLR
jgi:hypothetical protein